MQKCESARRSPYGFEISDNCPACKFRKNGFFCQLSPAELKDFDAVKFVSAYPADAFLFVEQQRPRGIHVLCEGQVKLSFSSSEGKTLALKIARPGDVFGLFSVLSDKPYEVTARTLRPCQVAFVSTSHFQQFLQKHPDVFQNVVSHLGMHYSSACEQLRMIGLGASTLERVANFLLHWSADRGAAQDGMQFTLPLGHEQMAEYIGTTRESVTRALGEFRSRGLIEGCGSVLRIPDRLALQEIRASSADPQEPSSRSGRLTPIRQRFREIRRSISKRAAGRFKSA